MLKNKSFLAIVPARGGSKGIPNKNIYPVRGIPLISYTLREAKKSRYIDKIAVSTDDGKIAEVSQGDNIEVIRRPAELAADNSKTIDAILHALSAIDKSYDFLVLLQATSPLRKSYHIDEAIEKFINAGCIPLASVSPAEHHPLLMRKMDSSGQLINLLEQSSTIRRQDMPDFYHVNGAIYINNISDLNKNTSFNDNPLGYIMPSIYSLDIDEPLDLKFLEAAQEYLSYTEKGEG